MSTIRLALTMLVATVVLVGGLALLALTGAGLSATRPTPPPAERAALTPSPRPAPERSPTAPTRSEASDARPRVTGRVRCVNTPDSCTGVVYGAQGLPQAVVDATAHPGPDTIIIGPGRYEAIIAYSAADPVSIIGAGAQRTEIVADPGAGAVVSVAGGAHSLADLTITQHGNGGIGLSLTGTTEAVRVRARALGTQDAVAVSLFGQSVLRQSQVVTARPRSAAVLVSQGTPQVIDSTIIIGGEAGVIVAPDALEDSLRISASTIRTAAHRERATREMIEGTSLVLMSGAGSLEITDTILTLGARTGSVGVLVRDPLVRDPRPGTEQPSQVRVQRTRILGAGANQAGLRVFMEGGATDVRLERSLIDLAASDAVPFMCVSTADEPSVITTDASAYQVGRVKAGEGCSLRAIAAVNLTTG